MGKRMLSLQWSSNLVKRTMKGAECEAKEWKIGGETLKMSANQQIKDHANTAIAKSRVKSKCEVAPNGRDAFQTGVGSDGRFFWPQD